jgi:hypothetical protein
MVEMRGLTVEECLGESLRECLTDPKDEAENPAEWILQAGAFVANVKFCVTAPAGLKTKHEGHE